MKDKKSLLMIIDILNEYTDSDHILTCNELIDKVKTKYKLELDRRTVYYDINLLIDFGYDISTYADNKKGYYLASREFDKSQIFLLCNAIHASNFIPKDASNELIDKLLKTQNKYVAEEFRDNVYVENSKKKENKDFFYNIEILSEAIRDHKTISFDYTEYNFKKELVKKNEKSYIVSPYYLISDGNLMFLVARFKGFKDLSHYRIDRIKNIEFADAVYEKLKEKQDAYKYAKNKTYMYSGEEIEVTLKCKNSVLNSLIDVFGKEIIIKENKDDYFIATVKTTDLGMYHLALHFVDSIEILEPKELRNKVKQSIINASIKYKQQ